MKVWFSSTPKERLELHRKTKEKRRKCKICFKPLADCNKRDICFHHYTNERPLTPMDNQSEFTSRPQPLLQEEFDSPSSWL